MDDRDPHITVTDEWGNEIIPKETHIEEDAEGIFLVRVVLNNSDLAGKLST